MQWLMLQQDHPRDYVIATGVQYSVRQFIEKSASQLGITLRFEEHGVNEVAVVESITGDKAPALKVGDVIVRVDPHYFRPAEVQTLLGDPSLAKNDLGWTPQVALDQLVQEMVASDLEQARQYALLQKHGYAVQVSMEK